jgi:hypothetical protein
MAGTEARSASSGFGAHRADGGPDQGQHEPTHPRRRQHAHRSRTRWTKTPPPSPIAAAPTATAGCAAAPVLVPGPTALITAGTSPTASTPSVDTTDDQKGTVTARGENGSGEAKERLFDNQRDSKWLDFSPQGSWVQYSYAPGIAGRLTGYTLTSAGDAPERDPADWQLQGSNDGGSSWVTVDTRTGVTFAERHQKQAFTVSGSPTYKAYRLNITKVLDASRANCVQLAEFELLGQQVSA